MSFQPQLPFQEVIEASIKDMRNSLSQVLFKLDSAIANTDGVDRNMFAEAQYEIVRMQNVISQMYGLYLVNDDKLVVSASETFVLELVEDTLAGLDALLQQKGIEVTVQGEDISWYLDSQLMETVLQIALLNALRYTNNKIDIQFKATSDGLLLSVIDNGRGYPEFILEAYDALVSGSSVDNVTSQNTGWLYCDKVVRLHTNQGRFGRTTLKNDDTTGGGRIDMLIP